MIKYCEMTAGAARQLVENCFLDLVDEQERWGAFMPSSNWPQLEIAEQRQSALEYIADLRNGIDTGSVDDAMAQRVEALLAKQGLIGTNLPAARRRDLSEGMARALIEQQNLFLLRLEDRLASFTPADPLFVGLKHEHAPVPMAVPLHVQHHHQPDAVTKGPTLGSAVEAYLKAKAKAWRPRTLKARKWQLGYLVDCLGSGVPLASITPADIRDFRDGVLALRANHGRSQTVPFAEKQTENVKARIQTKTAAIIFEPTKALFNWAEGNEGLIDRNPAKKITMVMPKKPKGERSRRPFEPDEVVQLFSCPLFTGCKSVHRRFEPGDKVIRDAKFWLPILGYYTGCRLGELIQLSISDVHIDDAYPHLSINETATVGGHEKSVKTEAGVRLVPLHADLLILGFGVFVTKRKGQDKPAVRLFKDIRYGCDGQASTEYSKIFARVMDKVGLTDRRLVFHSWRHGVEDALRDASIPAYAIDRIVGHSDETMGGKYGKGVSLPVLHKAVAEMALPVMLSTIVPAPSV